MFAFHEATRLACRRPQNTEQAQYSLPFPVAAALVHHRLGPALADPQILNLVDRVALIEDSAFNARFPAECLSRVVIETTDGTILDSGEAQAAWDASSPLPTGNCEKNSADQGRPGQPLSKR